MAPIRVVLCDGSPVIRRIMRDLLERAEDITVVGEADACADVLAMLAQADVLVLSLGHDDAGERELLNEMQAQAAAVRAIILASYPDPYLERLILEHGASAFLSKDQASQVLVPTIRQVMQES